MSLDEFKPLAQVAYEGYFVHTGGKTFDLRHNPQWAELPSGVQQAWCAAVKAVLGRVMPGATVSLGPLPDSATETPSADPPDCW